MAERALDATEAPLGAIRLAQAVSVIFHPAVLPTWAFSTLMLGGYIPTGLSEDLEYVMLGMLSLITLFIPVALLGVSHYFGIIADWQLRPKADRLYAMWLTVALYGSSTYMLMRYLPILLFQLMAGLVGLALFSALVNAFYRMSGHALAAAAFLGYWGSLAMQSGDIDLLVPFVATLLATGLSVWARLTLGMHTVGQIGWGLFCGLMGGIGIAYWPA